VQNLAKHSRRLQARHARKVDRRLGVPARLSTPTSPSRAMENRDLVRKIFRR
jgi:hypothetical protein